MQFKTSRFPFKNLVHRKRASAFHFEYQVKPQRKAQVKKTYLPLFPLFSLSSKRLLFLLLSAFFLLHFAFFIRFVLFPKTLLAIAGFHYHSKL